VLGVDISAPLLKRAAERARDQGNVSFELADAATHRFDTDCFHHLISRFGVMFFDDPAPAFANMARALAKGGKVSFGAWGQIPNNPFFTLAAQAAKSVVGTPPKVDPDLPGPFAFRDPDRVLRILREAGLSQPTCEVAAVDLTPAGGIDDFADLTASIGPADSAATHFNATPEQRMQLKQALADAFAGFQTDKGLRIPAEINFFSAVKP
jgi:SAM-dependent methyltransferase